MSDVSQETQAPDVYALVPVNQRAGDRWGAANCGRMKAGEAPSGTDGGRNAVTGRIVKGVREGEGATGLPIKEWSPYDQSYVPLECMNKVGQSLWDDV